MEINYNAEPTASKFHLDDSFYRCMRGPVRSGKSTACSVEIMNRASQQAKGVDGIRHTRWAVIRNTYRELEDTTMRTWLMWFPEAIFGRVNQRTMTHDIRFNDIHCEVHFRALDRPDDVAKLLSLEITGAWINEAREVPKVIADVVGDRVEQFPSVKDGGCTWGGVIMDTNAPDEDHWWFDLESKPPKVTLDDGKVVEWTFFTQPGALREVNGRFVANPKAENIANLNGGHNYYLKRVAGKKDSYIRVYYCNQFGYVEDGMRVHPEYTDATHCPGRKLEPDSRYPVVVGIDFGLTPAATFWQKNQMNQWCCFHEIASEDIGIKHFGEQLLIPYVISQLLDFDIEYYGDPAGSQRSQSDESQTPFKILAAMGIDAKPAPSNSETLRREALSAPLGRMVDGEPGVLVDPSCRVLRKGLSSKFIYKRIQVVGDEKFHSKPDKNFWSHTCESAEYAMLGAGEGKQIITKFRKPKPKVRVARVTGGWMGA